MAQSEKGQAGIGVDSFGDATIDPTANVLQLVQAAISRQDDLREAEVRYNRGMRKAERRYNGLRDRHQRNSDLSRSNHQRELDAKESARLDSIRQVDREEVAKTAAAANLAIAALAKATTDLAATLQNRVDTTAAVAEARRSADNAEINKRLSALELAGSEGKGKSTVADPAMERLAQSVEKLIGAGAIGTGRGMGMNAFWGYIIGAVGLVATVLAILSRLK